VTEIVSFLAEKAVDPEDPTTRLVSMSFDEMKIEEDLSYDSGLKMCPGLVTSCMAANEEDADKLATHVITVLLKGLTVNWKQIISFAFTAKCTSPELVWEYIKSAIIAVRQQGLKVTTLLCDSAGQNTAIGNLLRRRME